MNFLLTARLHPSPFSGEKKIDDIKGLQRGTRVLISLFENPWMELQFTHVKDHTRDKKFTAEEDRFLLCWAHKVSLSLAFSLDAFILLLTL